ncbi:MAG TPA: hypothetical protein VG204_02790 [Terriglobia bacterium]|nr:hypothetical protein [Terriglobia bacterium]
MGDRKYRQRGYQDDRGREPRQTGQRPGPRPETFGPKTPQMPGTHAVVRCAGCGTILPADFDPNGKCSRCGFELHSCKQCVHFDTSARFECTQPIPQRIAKKDAKNACTFYAPRTTVERQTSPGYSRSAANDPRKAFEDLFKK